MANNREEPVTVWNGRVFRKLQSASNDIKDDLIDSFFMYIAVDLYHSSFNRAVFRQTNIFKPLLCFSYRPVLLVNSSLSPWPQNALDNSTYLTDTTHTR